VKDLSHAFCMCRIQRKFSFHFFFSSSSSSSHLHACSIDGRISWFCRRLASSPARWTVCSQSSPRVSRWAAAIVACTTCAQSMHGV
jgi:hypothetical protein